MCDSCIFSGSTVLILNTELGDKLVVAQTDELLSSYEPIEAAQTSMLQEQITPLVCRVYQ